jgi:hypothetical protein
MLSNMKILIAFRQTEKSISLLFFIILTVILPFCIFGITIDRPFSLNLFLMV